MEERVFLITGGANGIGKYLVEHFSAKGNKVIFCDKDATNGELLSKKTNSIFFNCDMTNEYELINLINLCYDRYGKLDILINNAGLSIFKSLLHLTTDEWDYIINSNLRGAFILSREYAKRHNNTLKGSIINIASTRAFMSEPNSEAYAASKGGIVSLTHALALSLSEHNIKVNCIAPGWIHNGDYSELTQSDHDQHPSKRVGTPLDIAKACDFLADINNDFINGETIVVDGGMTKKMIYV